jgi:alkaline phosphatase D
VPQKLWYTFSDGCCDFFVTDTRTERLLSDDPADRQIMSDRQLTAIKAWLVDGAERIKFVVSSAPFFPDPIPTADREDKWSGFISQRDEILDVIRRNSVQRVVFLGGDYHASMHAELVSPDAPDFRILSVVSSAFYWPYRHDGARKYQLDGTLATMSEQRYEVVNSSPIQSTDNFTRVTANMDRIGVEVFGRKGELLFSSAYSF